MSDFIFDALYAEICRGLEEKPRWYVLVDPVIDDPLAECDGRQEAISLPISHPDLHKKFRPYLLLLGEPGRDERIEVTLRLAIAEATRTAHGKVGIRTICGWIVSSWPTSRLTARLARHATVAIEGRMRLLRFWDPRTLDFLELTTDLQQRHSLMDGISDWWWLGRNGGIKSMLAAEDAQSERLSLRQEQAEALLHSEPFHGALDVLQDMGRAVTDRAVCIVILKALQRGVTQWRLTKKLDLVQFALHAALVHPQFDKDEKVMFAMHEAASRGTSATSALASFTDGQWNEVSERLGALTAQKSIGYRQEVVDHG